MNEEEIIGTFEHWIEYEKANKDKINKADELIEIQQGLLDLYQQEKEKNKELIDFIETIEELKQAKKPITDLVYEMNKFEDEFISKDKIKDMIKQKQERINQMHPASDCVIIDDLENQINVLKELLE